MLQRYVNRRKRGSFLLSADPDLLYAGKRQCLVRALIERAYPNTSSALVISSVSPSTTEACPVIVPAEEGFANTSARAARNKRTIAGLFSERNTTTWRFSSLPSGVLY
jgi:hypothetical protein